MIRCLKNSQATSLFFASTNSPPRLLASSHSNFLGITHLKHCTLPHPTPLLTLKLTTTAAHQRKHKNPYSKQNNKTKQSNIDPIWTNLITRLVKGAALFAAVSAVLLSSVASAHAARSGGRIGGASFGRPAFHGSGSGAFGSRSSSMSGSSFTTSSGLSSRHHSSSSMPSYRSSVSTNAFFFSPFGFGFGYGYPMGGGFAQLIFWAVFATIAIQAVQGVLNNGGGGAGRELDGGVEKISVVKVQVGLLGTARDLQRDLERIAGRADTSSPRGLHYVLQETMLALMRNPDYCVYGYARSGVERSAEDAEARFNKLSLEERGKFEKETRINVGGRSAISRLDIKKDLSTPVSELLVVTILVAAEGRLKLPKVASRQELVDALTTLGAVRADDVLAVEVLWTPEEEEDYFTQEDLARDYPLLNTL